ncbi:MAG: hypothetical protein ACLFV5_00990 [Anaerolineales bacterium]
MPSVLAELNLGPAVGNAYDPTALAVDGHTAYVLCSHHGAPDAAGACMAVIDLEAGTVQDIWSLPGMPRAPMAAEGGWVYLICEREDGEYLLALDTADGQQVYDVDLRPLGYVDDMWVDAQRECLYLSLPDRLQVRDSRELDIIDDLVYPSRGAERRVVFTEDMDILLVSLSNTVYAYALPEITPLWEVKMPLETVRALIVDEGGEFFVVQGPLAQGEETSSVLLYSLDEGVLQEELARIDDQQKELVWGDVTSERLVFTYITYPPGQSYLLYLCSTDMTEEGTGEAWPFAGAVLADEQGDGARLYVLDRQGHRVIAVDGVTLEIDQSVQLGVELCGLIVDRDKESLYMNDTGAVVYEVDIAHLQKGTLGLDRSVPAGAGQMVLDDQNGLLLVGQGDGSQISIIDVDDFQVSRVITGGNRIALDARRARALVGAEGEVYQLGEGEVQIWDLMRDEHVGVIPEGGVPAYNALRDEIYVAAYGAHVYDGGSLERIDSLTPDIDAQSCRGCTGNQFVRDLKVHPTLGVLSVVVTTWGRGSGAVPTPRFFSLDTLTPVTHTISVLAGVGGERLLPPIGGRVYENVRYRGPDVSHVNLFVRDVESGEVISWRDGVLLEMLSPDGAQGFVPRDGHWLVVDTETWTPLGYTTRHRVHSYDGALDLFYALEGSRLALLQPQGGEFAVPTVPQQTTLEGGVAQLSLSPRYDVDKTLFVVSENALYRSHTDGRDWVRLGGGLPQARHDTGAHLVLAMSSAYEDDGTLFVGGWDGDGQGFGVWRSLDRGDTWQPMWRGLTHLQVEEIALSQDYGIDGTLLAYCRYRDLSSHEVGRSLFRSSDRGQTWKLVAQVAEGEDLPRAEALLGEESEDTMLRAPKGSRILTWGDDPERTVFSLPAGEFVVAKQRSPFYDRDGTVYVLSSLGLYRSTDRGETWARAQGTPFSERRLEERFTDLDISVEGEERGLLALGDLVGQVYLVRAEEAVWRPVSASP